jgi:hypothetical protein
MMKLTLEQNALHSLHHAIEIMYMADSEEDKNFDRSFDDETHMVEWQEDGKLSFGLAEFTPPPAIYKLKFALLHLIQSAELILKAYIADIDPQAIFEPNNKPHKKPQTIKLKAALKFIKKHKPNLFLEDESALLQLAKNYRDNMEHYEFTFPKSKIKQLCVDFLALCAFLTQNLLSKNIHELFDYDALHDRTDPISGFLPSVLDGTSSLGRTSLVRIGMMWGDKNSSEKVFLCISCKKKTVSVGRDICMGCGTQGDEQGSRLMEELEEATVQFQKGRKNMYRKEVSALKNKGSLDET